MENVKKFTQPDNKMLQGRENKRTSRTNEDNKIPVVLVQVPFVVAYGSNAGILLSQLYYWTKKNKAVKLWFLDSSLTAQTGLNGRQLYSARKRLDKRGAITITHGVYKQIIYTVNLEVLENLRTQHILNGEAISTQSVELNQPNGGIKSTKRWVENTQSVGVSTQSVDSIYARNIACNLSGNLSASVKDSLPSDEVHSVLCDESVLVDSNVGVLKIDRANEKSTAPHTNDSKPSVSTAQTAQTAQTPRTAQTANAPIVTAQTAPNTAHAQTAQTAVVQNILAPSAKFTLAQTAQTPAPAQCKEYGIFKVKRKTDGKEWDRDYGELDLVSHAFVREGCEKHEYGSNKEIRDEFRDKRLIHDPFASEDIYDTTFIDEWEKSLPF